MKKKTFFFDTDVLTSGDYYPITFKDGRSLINIDRIRSSQPLDLGSFTRDSSYVPRSYTSSRIHSNYTEIFDDSNIDSPIVKLY